MIGGPNVNFWAQNTVLHKKYDHLGHTCSLKFVFYFILFLNIENKEQRPNNF